MEVHKRRIVDGLNRCRKLTTNRCIARKCQNCKILTVWIVAQNFWGLKQLHKTYNRPICFTETRKRRIVDGLNHRRKLTINQCIARKCQNCKILKVWTVVQNFWWLKQLRKTYNIPFFHGNTQKEDCWWFKPLWKADNKPIHCKKMPKAQISDGLDGRANLTINRLLS